MTLEPLTEASLTPYVRMVVQLYVDDPSSTVMTAERAERQARFMLAHPHVARPLLVLHDGLTVGYAVLVPFFSNEYGGQVGIVDELFVDAAHRNRGHGSAILDQIALWARDNGFVMLELEVNAANTRARALYERNGFDAHTRVLMQRKP